VIFFFFPTSFFSCRLSFEKLLSQHYYYLPFCSYLTLCHQDIAINHLVNKYEWRHSIIIFLFIASFFFSINQVVNDLPYWLDISMNNFVYRCHCHHFVVFFLSFFSCFVLIGLLRMSCKQVLLQPTILLLLDFFVTKMLPRHCYQLFGSLVSLALFCRL